MPIQVLPPQLANQIAAGEVVERPASVVKELVENSLDAGATHIQIDIENGGSTLIRIRDNGMGIPKAELSLALARHATSKITSLEDLDAILSLGFRGEALASISSVSRLTLTSRTAEQNEAWQVYAQGREMETTIKPASHPVGTTVEVANLFFNTPARRKFLRTDKTEFSHIDEVIRRIALAKPNITFSLSHNGKTLRQYKNAQNGQMLKRVAAICGNDFVQNALQINWIHDDLHLSGWVALPSFVRTQNDLSYCYINGRMVRDKIINHAIRQAYADYLTTEQYPAFILFLDLNPHEVDVNVHPTKHEVRFHQQRLIHDFIYQGITHALSSEQAEKNTSELKYAATKPNQIQEPIPHWATSTQIRPNRATAGQNIFTSTNRTGNHISLNNTQISENRPHFLPKNSQEKTAKTERLAYNELLKSTNTDSISTIHLIDSTKEYTESYILKALALVAEKALLLQQHQQFYLLSLTKLQQLKIEFLLQQKPISQQPLLIPIIFRLNEAQLTHWLQQKSFFTQVGFEFSENLSQKRITLIRVPTCLREQNLQKCVIAVLSQSIYEFSLFLTALYKTLRSHPITIFADAVNLLTETERLLSPQQTNRLSELLIPIDWQPYLEQI
ncbi:DNA mismatch repair protein MutL [Pasteurella canis]|uniref:DNA mismatch repair endonuclease MutL n=1 Tax=Pasteurella canis TaxID=753 RepID=UPI001E58DE10|nr:DNA mismatch repair endonuclease MutL [Pasteurella canis]GJJ80559.1 DNA mismatch repair protein MutL [Pasteurella canis]